MAKGKDKVRNSPGNAPNKNAANEKLDRATELSTKKDVKDALLDIFKDIEKGFDEQADRANDNMDYWDCYNCVLGGQQFYQGNSQIFMPIVYNAVNARKTRFVNQLFPMSGRYVEVTTENGDQPQAEMALLEYYVRKAKLRTQIAPALMRNGDVEGQYTIQVTWEKTTRNVVQRVKRPAEDEDDGEVLDTGDDEDLVEDIEEDVLEEGHPVVNVVADSDILILPYTANSIAQALEEGGSVTTLCRWTKTKIERMIADDEILEDEGKALLKDLQKEEKTKTPDKGKEMVDAAGIKGDGRGFYALVYRTWVKLTVEGERRLCLVYYAGKKRILSCRRNPYWSDRVDIFSTPVEKIEGAFKGQSKVKPVADLQYQANDAVNEGMDSAAYALMPIILTDPEKNPNTASMILSLAAIWEADPNSTKFAEMPPLWKDALQIVATAQEMIFQTLSVNPAQITNANSPRKKPNQAEIANEQQIDILTTADVVTVLEDEIFSPMLSFMLELDHQYRDKPLLVRQFGELGARANMQEISVISMGKAYQFRWFGVEAARNAQQMQQQIAGINVIRGIPPQMYPGYRLDLAPALAQMVESLFGPRLGALTFVSARDELSVDPEDENRMLEEGLPAQVHPADDHAKHIKVHTKAMVQTGDLHGLIKPHIMQHLQAIQAEMMKQMQAQQGQPGTPGGAGKGVPGQPRIGAQPGQARPAQRPPGAIHADRLQDPAAAPAA